MLNSEHQSEWDRFELYHKSSTSERLWKPNIFLQETVEMMLGDPKGISEQAAVQISPLSAANDEAQNRRLSRISESCEWFRNNSKDSKLDTSEQLTKASTIATTQHIAVDVGCGSGRDAVFLALALGPEWQVIAIDNHKKALERTKALAEREGVGSQVYGLSSGSPAPRKQNCAVTLDTSSLCRNGTPLASLLIAWCDLGQILCRCIDLRSEGLVSVKGAKLIHGHRFLHKQLFDEVVKEVIGGATLLVCYQRFHVIC